MSRFFRLGFLLALFLPLAATAQSRTDCNVINSRILKQAVHYCVQLPPDYDANDPQIRRDAIPFSIFCTASDKTSKPCSDTGGWSLIEDLRRQHKIGDFLIVAPEGKRSFYINSADNSLRYSDFFLQEFMPYIEAQIPGAARDAQGGPSPASPWEAMGRCASPSPIPSYFPRSAHKAPP